MSTPLNKDLAAIASLPQRKDGTLARWSEDHGAWTIIEDRIAELEELLRRTLPHIGSNRATAYDDEKKLRAEIEAALSN